MTTEGKLVVPPLTSEEQYYVDCLTDKVKMNPDIPEDVKAVTIADISGFLNHRYMRGEPMKSALKALGRSIDELFMGYAIRANRRRFPHHDNT